MKPRTVTGDGTADDLVKLLRKRAEKIAWERKGRVLEDLSTLPPAAAQRLLHDLQVHQIELELQNEELRQSQDALEASRARYFDLYNLAPVGYFTLDDKGLIVEVNLTGATLLGVARGALAAQSFSRFVTADAADSFYLHHRQLLFTGKPQAFELRLSRKGDAPFTAWIEATVGAADSGARICHVIINDITERKKIEEGLLVKKNLLHTAGTMVLVGGWVVKLPHNELLWSDEMCVILGFPENVVPTFAESLTLYQPISREIISTAMNSCARDGISFDCELEIFTAKRRPLHVRVIGQAVRDAEGKITAIEGAFQDISERKKAEQERASLEGQLRESQKMEAIGTLAGGIAHDFNNILGSILGNVELARQDAAANWQALVSLDEIQKAGYRARELVQQILSFSRRQPTSRRSLVLGPVVEEAVSLLRAAFQGGVRIDYRCAADIPPVLADPNQVQQVLLNLGANAAHAMEGHSGGIDICVEGITLDAGLVRSELNLRPGRYARIVVSDTGHGMVEATRQRIFEPFFTTKPVGKGTGLGLAVAHGIMQAHDGTIIVQSTPGKGSRFELYFPRADEAVVALNAAGDAAAAGEGGGRHILYIDDDEAQVYMIKRMLERWGYRVSAYIEQREALSTLLAGNIRFDLVVTDFNMPGMSGLEIARAVRDAQPDLPVIVVSGYITDNLRVQAAAAGVRTLISKTHVVEELRDVLQEMAMKPTH